MKIVITGPESSGKTTLFEWIMHNYDLNMVQEWSRIYLNNRNNQYNKDDLYEIALLQSWEEKQYIMDTKPMVCDTDLLTIHLWHTIKYNSVNEDILAMWRNHIPDYYLLCKPDMPWEVDPLRENPRDRDKLFNIYLDEIINWQVPHIILEGNPSQRIEAFKEFFNALCVKN